MMYIIGRLHYTRQLNSGVLKLMSATLVDQHIHNLCFEFDPGCLVQGTSIVTPTSCPAQVAP